MHLVWPERPLNTQCAGWFLPVLVAAFAVGVESGGRHLLVSRPSHIISYIYFKAWPLANVALEVEPLEPVASSLYLPRICLSDKSEWLD